VAWDGDGEGVSPGGDREWDYFCGEGCPWGFCGWVGVPFGCCGCGFAVGFDWVRRGHRGRFVVAVSGAGFPRDPGCGDEGGGGGEKE